MKNDKKEKAKPSKRKAKPTKAGETTKQPKPSREKPKPKANEKDEQPKPSKKKPRPTKANEKDEQPKKTKANEKDEQPKKTKADENDEQPKKTKADENDDVTWSNLHEKGMLKGELSSAPYVDEGGDVVVRFQSGRVWRVPHLVPGDIDKSKGEQAALPRLGEVAESEVKKKKPAKPRPVSDFILASVRVKYASQGSKHPILKMECKGGPLRSHRRTVEAEDAVRLERRCGTGNGSGI